MNQRKKPTLEDALSRLLWMEYAEVEPERIATALASQSALFKALVDRRAARRLEEQSR